MLSEYNMHAFGVQYACYWSAICMLSECNMHAIGVQYACYWSAIYMLLESGKQQKEQSDENHVWLLF